MTRRAKIQHEKLWAEFWKHRDSSNAASELIEAWMPLVHRILNRITIRLPAHVLVDDLLQCAVVGLYESIERFDPEHGTSFAGFATRRIRGAIIDELRNSDHMTRSNRSQFKQIESGMLEFTAKHGRTPTESELADYLSIPAKRIALLTANAHPWLSLDQVVMSGRDGQKIYLRDVLADDRAAPPDKEAIREDIRRELREAFKHLSWRDQKILYLYYFEELRLSEIAELFELSEARICQIHALIITRMKAFMNKSEYKMAS